MIQVFRPTIGIYYLYKDSELLYIGQATDCEYRIRQHKSKGFNRYQIEPCKPEELLKREREAISLNNPKLNKARYNDREASNNLEIAHTQDTL